MDLVTYVWVVVGIIISVVLPVLSGLVRKEFPPTAGVGLPPWVRKYTILLLFAAVTGVIVLAGYGEANPDARLSTEGAIILGFSWEAFLEKFTKKSPGEL